MTTQVKAVDDILTTLHDDTDDLLDDTDDTDDPYDKTYVNALKGKGIFFALPLLLQVQARLATVVSIRWVTRYYVSWYYLLMIANDDSDDSDKQSDEKEEWRP